jgi:hypothetical protein
MSLAKEYGADRIWIVNVGHFKGLELPMEYFLDLAWNTRRWTNDNIHDYMGQWAEREFGPANAGEIAGILAHYTKYNGRRKPELLSPSTYSLVNYHEAERVVADYRAIVAKAESLHAALPVIDRDAFYQLVLFPAKAPAIVNELYVSAGKNALYARQGRAAANGMAARTRELFDADTALMGHYNRVLAGGKWDHFMDQAHLGYTSWQDPPENSLRAIPLVEPPVPEQASLGVSIEGTASTWPGPHGDPVLPPFDRRSCNSRRIEVFNKGMGTFAFTAAADRPWIILSRSGGELGQQEEIWVSIDRAEVPDGSARGTVTISGAGSRIGVRVEVPPGPPGTPGPSGSFLEHDRHVSIEAEHFARITAHGENRWIRVEDYGHTLSAMRATSPPGAPPATPGKDSPCLEYRMLLADSGRVTVRCTFSASLNFLPNRDLRYAVSFDDGPPQTVILVPRTFIAQHHNMDWEKVVADTARHSHTEFALRAAGLHTLKIWMVDPGAVLQRIVVDRGGMRESYLGPPESVFLPGDGR